ncbi:hypothetical protein D9758_008276 [Tetrapyrgos nigripes]|uniref:Uncharacterized protein n=1 Tax=Tetrapyrgos nigripes TaxID=182062 RepID=A0A8H5LGQ0_9AGAR|nr:hypothetical protein D9758_008276 [Tetrapyrgos nigripes]
MADHVMMYSYKASLMTTTTTTLDSPFSHLLSSNYAASDSDVPRVKVIITSSSDTLRRLNSEIQKLQTALRELEQKRNSVQTCIDAHRALFSPAPCGNTLRDICPLSPKRPQSQL